MEIFQQEKVKDMLQLVQQYHAEQFRNNGKVPYWHHCLSVAEIVIVAFEQTGELENNNDLLVSIACSALGHDLLEDTAVTRLAIRDRFGLRVEEMIISLTNEEDDAHRDKYMRKIAASSEELALIKYADLIENTISCAYGINDLGVDWIKSFYLPIKDETEKILASKKFSIYAETANLLRIQYRFAAERLDNNFIKYRKVGI